MDFSTHERQHELQAAAAVAATAEELESVVERVTSAFGFRDYIVMVIPETQCIRLAYLVRMSSLPKSLFEAFDLHGLSSAPLTRRLLEQSFARSQWLFEDLPASEHPSSRRLRRLMGRHKLKMGVAFAHAMTSREKLGILFLGDRPPLSQSEQHDLSLIARKVCSHYEGIGHISTAGLCKLSARELEVVGWSAEGKTSSEIASILGLSDHTVNAYLANAIRKLDCVNRTQLVAKALRLKLID
ncbi:helix-turn-helix transcriptional regulator [Martelella mediterranea]|uniref:DNA-binding CsgD family transcriptional regulator n=1 Tax=Martelella mediterranea TaxID=293089 RepID=A0A4R3NIT5_9HYPH|nr:helix-turn-helix transcriptional regulator [Martelella mediterranea]TCT31754.1 DNA-binding CsgD family transcriptional regulator [Martelella mediterranea]